MGWILENDFILHMGLTALFYYPLSLLANKFADNWEKHFGLTLTFIATIALAWEACQVEMHLNRCGYTWQAFLSYWWLDTGLDLLATMIGVFVAVVVTVLIMRLE